MWSRYRKRIHFLSVVRPTGRLRRCTDPWLALLLSGTPTANGMCLGAPATISARPFGAGRLR